jgi:hypothetical protein
MTSERHQMLEGLDSRNFAAPIRQVLERDVFRLVPASESQVLVSHDLFLDQVGPLF